MSELQPAEAEDKTVIDGGVEEETGTGDGAELATATEDKQDKSDDGVQKAINKQHAKYREEERKRIASENEAEELRGKLAALQAESGEVVIPPVPDPYDEDYEGKIKARDEAITRKAEIDAQKTVAQSQGERDKQVLADAEKDRIEGVVREYDSRAVQLGLNVEEVKKAGDTIIDYGISGELALYLLEDSDGPLLTKYLASNPLELDEIRGMTPINAAIKLNSTIREKAILLKPKATNTPDPAQILDGGGVPETVSPLIKGATFE